MSDQPEINPRRDPAGPPAGAREPVMPEDAGARALNEALHSIFLIVQFVVYALLVWFLVSGVFTVGPSERAILLRFGRPVGQGALLKPGFHWAFPQPIDEVKKIPFGRSLTNVSTVGWYQETGGADLPRNSLNPAADGYTLTGDGNIIHARATLSYHVDDPMKYEFDFVDVTNSVRNILDNALLYTSARFKVDDALYRDRIRFKEAVQARVDELARAEGLGIAVEQCLVESMPPRFLSNDFAQVTIKSAEAESKRNAALTFSNQMTALAQAEAARLTNSALADSTNMVKSIKADADRFTDLLPQYRKNPYLVTSLLISQAVGDEIGNVQDIFYLPQSPTGEPWEIRIDLNRGPKRQTGPGAAPSPGLIGD